MRITWDPRKSQINMEKHKLPFDIAQEVFDDPLCRTSDAYEENGEWRYDTTGRLDARTTILVSHTWDIVDGEEHIRLISARKADKQERQGYENG